MLLEDLNDLLDMALGEKLPVVIDPDKWIPERAMAAEDAALANRYF